MLFDCHIHSTISSDAESSIMDICRSAVRKGVSIVCFTEHFDMNPADSNYRFYNHEHYVSEVEQARAVFAGKIEILMGIEFSEPHLYPGDFERMLKHEFDFVLGSVHTFQGTWAGAEGVLEKYSVDEIFGMHYAETLRMVQFGGFDSLAHMDFPRRYIAEHKEPIDLIDPILAALVRSNISLELNSSPLRKGNEFTLPSPAILERYKGLGGKYVTLGSDAHKSDEIASGYEHLAAQMASHQLAPVVYRGRKLFAVA